MDGELGTVASKESKVKQVRAAGCSFLVALFSGQAQVRRTARERVRSGQMRTEGWLKQRNSWSIHSEYS